MTDYTNLTIYDPDGDAIHDESHIPENAHIPREGELVFASDHRDGYHKGTSYRVRQVQSEYRTRDGATDNLDPFTIQFVYIRTEAVDD